MPRPLALPVPLYTASASGPLAVPVAAGATGRHLHPSQPQAEPFKLVRRTLQYTCSFQVTADYGTVNFKAINLRSEAWTIAHHEVNGAHTHARATSNQLVATKKLSGLCCEF